ncbi:hypothetical protein CO058_02000 [candidate division WWE3 bacterium CG_4_9_14_0_2_um_filter_35_11]|uniref:LysM domain-containing protein n=1 Tax=candidate division WWE3 bacterium CG_4_9_14_0_2_um_filter_35_11 TaxID=1975077 RepID=A0A2M8ELU6_UNCKA|nr:MAG: hypothetical protein COV25_03350 [candidate division WWE3 bacterium CG10_big_fil_rev_8_21_14_0_10_35_32]PJC23712.1 MAG: hypothetical protein CO058_02000 [candidate division WWE3 bacterium CG_4_9_14_0_2_um_filter_35_11]
MSEEIQETQKKQEVAKYIYILVIFIGLIVLGSTYIAYTYFNTSKNNVSTDDIANVDVTEVVPVTDDSGFQTPVLGDSFGITDGREVADNSVKTLVPVPAKEVEAVQLEKTTASDTSGISNARTWKANDYKFGDIKIGSYTVIYGDTLWELAEGAYGLGSKWINIANVNTIQYFANGRPLIEVGQVLTIPEDK